jgi:hypothetical protein
MADTFAYYVAAYVVTGALLAGYVVSLAVRARRIAPGANRREPPAGA